MGQDLPKEIGRVLLKLTEKGAGVYMKVLHTLLATTG